MIKYRKGYKYQLAEMYVHDLGASLSDVDIFTEFIKLTTSGVLTIKPNYAWDGPSGPTIDTPSFMRGSLVHDALYQLLRGGHVRPSQRKFADKVLRDICVEDGMYRWRAWYVYRGVRAAAGFAADPSHKKKVHSAP